MSERALMELDQVARAAVQAATQRSEPQWAGLRVELPACDSLAVFESGDFRQRFYWERPAQARALVGLGCVAAIETSGDKRFAESSARAKALFAALHVAGDCGDKGRLAGPFLVGGFAFSDCESAATHWAEFPNSRLVLPRVAVAIAEGRTWCTILCKVEPGDDAREVTRQLRADRAQLESRLALAAADVAGAPCTLRPGANSGANAVPAYHAVADRSHEAYRGQVREALRGIAEGAFEKVVLARSVCLRRQGDFEARSLLDALRRAHPSCAIFAIGGPSSVFLGATPECLLRLQGSRLETASLAGSAPRGLSQQEDSQLGRELLESKKEQTEHAIVVRALRAALTPYCQDLVVPESPRLMRLQYVQHLETPITGRVGEQTSVLDLLGAVHPTPAIGGEPRDAALAWLVEHEHLDRGWYAGPVGFADAGGGGEFFTALRCCLLRGGEARLFAGGGIVEGSEPELELCETRLKLRAMLAPLFEI